jgi:radical SAM protein with 4Fe4S-binding SPASM domain
MRNLNGLLLKISDKCNFSCNYCIDRACGTQDRAGNMSPEVALKAIDLFLDFRRRHPNAKPEPVSIGFNGGEPLLNFGLIRDCIRFIRERHRDAVVDYDINTNAALLTDAVARVLKREHFSITTSLDGTLALNDAQRRSKVPHASAFAATVEGLRCLKAAGHSSHAAIILVLTETNIEAVDGSFLRFVRTTLGVPRLVIEPDMSRALSLSPKELAQRVLAIKNEAQKVAGLTVGGGWSTPFLNLIKANPHRTPSYCSALSGFSVNVFPTGDIRACNYLDSSFTLVNVRDVSRFEDIVDHDSFKRSILENFGGMKDGCANCSITGLCKGGCLVTATRGEETKAFHCEFLREITDLLIRECVIANN